MEYSIFEEAVGEGKTKPQGWFINPVFFAKGLNPTLVQLHFLVGGRKQPGSGPGKPLPSPLYQAFLNVDASSASAIMDFMNTYKVHLFPAIWDPQRLLDYVSGAQRSTRMTLKITEGQLKKFWAAEQTRMRHVLELAAQGRWEHIAFPPAFPVCENALVEWRLISGYFDPELAQAQIPQGVGLALFQFKEAGTPGAVVNVRRYYGWDSYMWAELANDMRRGKAALVCASCGRVISRGRHGRPRRFCTKEENPRCHKERTATKVSASRKRQS